MNFNPALLETKHKVLDFPFGPTSKFDHFRDLAKMVVHTYILTVTRFYRSIDCCKEILPSGISKHLLQVTGKPNLHLLLAIVTFNIGSNRIKCSFVLYYTLFVHSKETFNSTKLPNILQQSVMFPIFFVYLLHESLAKLK